ncbi:MAG: hypothetical protein ACRD18_11465 [Terriglobia bacterium]
MKMAASFITALCVGVVTCGMALAVQPPQSAQSAQSTQSDQPPVLVRTNSSGQPTSPISPDSSVQAARPVGTALTGKAAADTPPPISAGTTLRVQLDTTLTDKTNKTGDAFTGEIMDPVMTDGKDVLPKYSTVNGHIAFLKPSGRVEGKAQMRLVIDNISTPDGVVYPLSGTLEQAQGGVCAHASNTGKTKADEEGTITGCGKSKKKAAEAAAIAGGMGAGVGASIGMGKVMECDYYGYCPPGGSGIGTDIMYGAGIGAATALVYTIFKHERHIVLVQGSVLTFVVNRTTMADKVPAATTTASDNPQ